MSAAPTGAATLRLDVNGGVAWVLNQLERGVAQVTNLPVRRSTVSGCIGME